MEGALARRALQEARGPSEWKDDPHILEFGERPGGELEQLGRPAALPTPLANRFQDAEERELATLPRRDSPVAQPKRRGETISQAVVTP